MTCRAGVDGALVLLAALGVHRPMHALALQNSLECMQMGQ